MNKIVYMGIFIILVLFYGCLDSGTQGKIPIKIESEISELETDIRSSSEDKLDFELINNTENDYNMLSFDMIVENGELELSEVEKYDFSNQNLVVSHKISGGYRFIFSDFENNLKKKEKFAKITLLKISGSDILVELKNYQKE